MNVEWNFGLLSKTYIQIHSKYTARESSGSCSEGKNRELKMQNVYIYIQLVCVVVVLGYIFK